MNPVCVFRRGTSAEYGGFLTKVTRTSTKIRLSGGCRNTPIGRETASTGMGVGAAMTGLRAIGGRHETWASCCRLQPISKQTWDAALHQRRQLHDPTWCEAPAGVGPARAEHASALEAYFNACPASNVA